MPEAELAVLEPGDVVRSLKGRDTGEVALVWGVLSDHRVAIVDGDVHPITRPKQKNRRHLARLGHQKELASRMAQARITDADLRAALAVYREAAAQARVAGSPSPNPEKELPAASGDDTGLAKALPGGAAPGPTAADPEPTGPMATEPRGRSGDSARKGG